MTDMPVGDRGQRYEVRFLDENDKERVLGWTQTERGVETFKRAIAAHPNWHSPKVIDRKPS